MVGADEAVVGVLEVRLQGDDSLLGNFPDLLLQTSHILSQLGQRLDYCCVQLLRTILVVVELV